MSQLAEKDAINREIRLTSSSFDERLACIEQYLRERFAACDAEIFCGKDPVAIDLGVLDLASSSREKGTLKRWQDHETVYSLRIDHAHIILGPFYKPGKGGPCPICLEQRWKMNRACELLDEGQPMLASAQQMLAFGSNALLTPFALEVMWEVLLSVLARKDTEQMHNQLYALKLRSLTLTSYHLIPDTLCPVCATPTVVTAQDTLLQLVPRPKRTPTDYHLLPAPSYSLSAKEYLNPICGVLGSEYYLSDDHTIDAPIIGRFAVENLQGRLFRVHWGSHGRSYSLQTGLLEALERYAWTRTKEREVIFESYQHIKDQALHPAEVGLYRSEFYQAHPDSFIPFSADVATRWIWGYSFRQARPILVLEQLVHPNRYEVPNFVSTTTSGCAIGSTVEEALLFGLLESIERDGLLLTWYTKIAPRRINLWQCSNRQILHLLDRFEKRGYDLHLLDTRFDMPVPSVVAVAALRTFTPENRKIAVSVGCGASLSPEKAVLSALAEAGYWVDNVHMEDHMDEMRELAQDYNKIKSVVDHGLVYGLPEAATRLAFLYQNPQEYSFDAAYAEWRAHYPQTLDLRDDLLYCINTILNMGMDVIAVDLTNAEQERTGLKTFKVIVPGLLPIDFGGGRVRVLDLPRLRTAPRKAGYLPYDFDPSNYNRDPHPFT
ncbi:MAG TPA: TOMM precursor leader peptide-binding protein [Ktedonobacteraceae bacterium]|nr:TOMM precursor leader peptide-binding protein [Ktedonobacteraceae bacterium]